jgi:hypothetical protein
MITDHRAEAASLIAPPEGDTVDERAHNSRMLLALVHATLADRCPDPTAHVVEHEVECPECGATIRARMADAPAAHQAEDTGVDAGTVAALRTRITDLERDRELMRERREALERELVEARAARPASSEDDVTGAAHRHAAGYFAPSGPDDDSLPSVEAQNVATDFAKDLLRSLGATRPAPIRPEVVAVVATAEALFGDPDSETALSRVLKAVRALPEDWRDGAAPAADGWSPRLAAAIGAANLQGATWEEVEGAMDEAMSLYTWGTGDDAAPAAVPAVLDEAGIDRAARALAVDHTIRFDQLGEPGRDNLRRNATTAVRAYLGDTDTGSEN